MTSSKYLTYEDQEDSFVQSCDTYAIYEALEVVDRIEDISIRINVRENDIGEIEEAVEEIVRLARQARDMLETVTGDYPEEDEYWAEPDKDDPNDDA